jgi:aspartate/tyrosine/aromatic aminotransferase
MANEVEVEVLKSVVKKLDSSLDKITEVSNSIAKLLAVHDERLGSLEKISDKREDEIKDLHSRITTQTREIFDKLELMEARIERRIAEGGIATSSQHDRINAEMKAEIHKISERITLLEGWRWYVLGAAAVVGWILSKYGDLTSLLK